VWEIGGGKGKKSVKISLDGCDKPKKICNNRWVGGMDVLDLQGCSLTSLSFQSRSRPRIMLYTIMIDILSKSIFKTYVSFMNFKGFIVGKQ
jgi:hypothetical protein